MERGEPKIIYLKRDDVSSRAGLQVALSLAEIPRDGCRPRCKQMLKYPAGESGESGARRLLSRLFRKFRIERFIYFFFLSPVGRNFYVFAVADCNGGHFIALAFIPLARSLARLSVNMANRLVERAAYDESGIENIGLFLIPPFIPATQIVTTIRQIFM